MSGTSIRRRLRHLLGLRRARRKLRCPILLWSLFVALLVSGAFVLGGFEGLELRLVDWRTRLGSPATPPLQPRIAIAVVTERDLRLLGETWPLSRERYADLVEALHRQGAAVIALDVVLPPTPASSSADQKLARACARVGNVILATYSPQIPAGAPPKPSGRDRSVAVSSMLENAPEVVAAAAGIGHLHVHTDADGTVRRVPLFVRCKKKEYPPLGVAAAALYRTGRPEPPPSLRDAADSAGRVWIRYRNPRDAIDLREDGGLLRRAGIDLQRPFELYSLAEILDPHFGRQGGTLRGKVVLIGCALNGFGAAQHPTPFGRQHGVFVQAAILDTALGGAPIRRIPRAAAIGITVLIALASGSLFSRIGGPSAACWLLAMVGLVVGAGVVAFSRYGLIVDLVPPLAAATLSCGGVLLIGLGMARIEVAKRNRELDALLEAGTASVSLVGPGLTGPRPLDGSTPGARILGPMVIPETTPQIVANTFGQAMRAAGCLLYARPPSGARMTLAASYGFGPDLDKARCISVSGCLNRHVLEAGRPVLVGRPPAEDLPCALPDQVRSVLLVPLTIGGETIGTVHLFNKVPQSARDDGMFRHDDLRTATILGCQSAVSLQNARLYLDRHRLFLDFVEAIATSVDLKDRYTHGHSKRVAEHSAGIAAELGLSRTEIQLVALAARLHDVGKIGTPDLLLRKRGRLTQQEFEVIKAHTTNAERLFRGKPGWHTLLPGIRHHHERFNSTGYPDGLRGGRIPVAARIIAVADAFDAMTSDRPYRHRMEIPEACEEIKACSGTQFDPRIAAAFLRYYRRRFGPPAARGPRRRERIVRLRPLGAAAE